MRFAPLGLLALGLAGCLIRTEPVGDDFDDPPPSGGWGSGWGGGGGPTSYGCRLDSECGANVCARNGECLPASEVRLVHVDWTVRTQVANGTSCSAAPDLDITFYSNVGEEFGFSPVPCDAGRFTVDKLPLRYTTVQLARAGDYGGGDSGMFDVEGNVLLDLPY